MSFHSPFPVLDTGLSRSFFFSVVLYSVSVMKGFGGSWCFQRSCNVLWSRSWFFFFFFRVGFLLVYCNVWCVVCVSVCWEWSVLQSAWRYVRLKIRVYIYYVQLTIYTRQVSALKLYAKMRITDLFCQSPKKKR